MTDTPREARRVHRCWTLTFVLVLGLAATLGVSTQVPAATGHLSPDPTDSSLDWTHGVPLSDLDQAAAAGEVTVVVTAAGHSPIVRNVALTDTETFDADGDGDVDVRASLSIDTSTSPPTAELLTTAGPEGAGQTPPEDVEVLTFVPWDDHTDESTPERPNLIVGYRTAEVDPTTLEITEGGVVPGQVVQEFQLDQVSGLQHQLTVSYRAESPPNPLRLLVGHFDGTEASGVVNADLVSALPRQALGEVDISLGVDAHQLDADPSKAKADLSWTASAPSLVELDYLEAESAPTATPEVETTVEVDRMPTDETLTLTLDEDASTPAKLDHTSNQAIGAVTAHHTRPDGTELEVGFGDVPTEATLSVTSDGKVDLSVPTGGRISVFAEARLPDGPSGPDGRALFGESSFSHEIDHLYVEVHEAPQMSFTPRFGTDAGLDVSLSEQDAISDVRFVASDDLDDPNLPGDFLVSGHPASWGAAGPYTGEFAVIDDAGGSTIAARVGNLQKLSVTVGPGNLANQIAITTDEDQRFTVDHDVYAILGSGAPMANGTATEVTCEVELATGANSLDLQQPDHYGFDLAGEMPQLRCDGERGPESFELRADGVPGQTTVSLDLDSTASGSLQVSATAADGSRNDVDIDELYLDLTNETDGLTGPDLLGSPARFGSVRAEGLPSTIVDWSTNADPDAPGTTSVDVTAIEADATENVIDELRFRLRTDDPGFERFSDIPGSFLGSGQHYLEAVESDGGVRIGAGVEDAHELHIGTDDASTTLSAEADLLQAHPLVFSLDTTENGPFTSGWALSDWSCDLGPVPAADDLTLSLTPPETLSLDATASGFGDIGNCGGEVSRSSDGLDAFGRFDAADLPSHLQLDVSPGSSLSLDVGTDAAGFIEAGIEDRSSSGLPNTGGLFQQPLEAASLRMDDAHSSTVRWTNDGAVRLTAAPDIPNGPVGSVRVELTTDGSVTRFDPIAPDAAHRFKLLESIRDSSYRGSLEARLISIGASHATADGGLDAELNTVADRMLEADVSTDSGGEILPALDVDADIQVENVPGSLTYHTDLAGHHEVTASDDIAELRFDGTVDDIHANGRATDVPTDVTIDTETLSVTSGSPIGSIDVKATDTSDASGLFNGINEARITAEGIPGDLSVDLDGLAASTTVKQGSDGSVEVLDGTASITEGNGSSGPIDRLAVTVSSTKGDGFFGTPYTYAKVDLEGVPTSWTISYRHDADTGDTDVEVQPGSGSLSSASIQVTRKEGGAEAVSDELAAFEQTAVGMDRSDYTAEIDRRYFPTSIEQRLDDLFSDAARFATTTRTAPVDPWLQQTGSSPAKLTVPDQDHAIILGELFDPTLISARISDVSAATISSSGNRGASGTIERSGGGPVPFFLGYRHTAHTDYDFPELRSVPDRESGHPKARDNVAPGKFYEVTETGPKHFTVLGNDDPASDSDGDQLDESTLRIVQGPDHGTVTLEDPVEGHPQRHIAYEPEDGHDGTDQVTYEICDNDGDCSQAVVLITTREEYQQAIIARIADSPGDLTFNVKRTQVNEDGDKYWETREVDYTADRSLGRVDLHVGPFEPLKVADPQRIRGILYDGPAEVSADLHGTEGLLRLTDDGSWLFPDGGSGLFGAEIKNFDIDTSSVSDLVFATEDRTQRVVAGMKGEDLSIDTPLEGSFAGDTFAFEAIGCAPLCGVVNKGHHPHFLPNVDGTNGCHFRHFGAACAQLLYTAFDLDAKGDTTGKPASGFAALYQRRQDPDRLSPSGPAPGSEEWVPSATGEFQGVSSVDVGVEARLLLGARFPLGIKPFGRLGFSSFPIATGDLWWNSDGRVCSPVPSAYRDQISRTLGKDDTFRWGSDLLVELQGNELCFEFGTPDYVDNTPTISFDPAPSGFDPYSGQAPQAVDRLASGAATAGSPFVSPMLRFYVIPLDTELAPFGSLGMGRFSAAAATGTVELTEVALDQVDAPIAGEPLAAVRIDGHDETVADGVLVGFDLAQLAPDGRPVCAANQLPDGSVGSVRCIDVNHERGVEMDLGGRLELVIDQPGTVVLVDRTDVDAGSIRAAGPTRIGTAVEAARAGWSTARTVVLATAHDFPDALAAAPLAGALDAPILLTSTGRLDPQVRSTIRQLGTERVVIVGGPAAISDGVADELTALGLSVDRIGGTDRFATARMLAAEASQLSTPDDAGLAFVASAHSFADALAISPVAADRNQPLYLTRFNTIGEHTIQAMRDAGVDRVRIVGGNAVVSSRVVAELELAGITVVERLAGADRFATGREVADWAADTGTDLRGVLAATGLKFPDTLTSGALGGRLGRLVLLVNPTVGADQPAARFLADHTETVRNITVIGGTEAVPRSVEEALVEAADGS